MLPLEMRARLEPVGNQQWMNFVTITHSFADLALKAISKNLHQILYASQFLLLGLFL